MNTILLFAAIGSAVGIFHPSGDYRLISSAFYTLIGALIGLVAALTIMCAMVPTHEVVSSPIKLVAMRSADGISGTFVLGSGSVRSDNSYNFLQQMDDGSMVPGSVPADGRVHLIEDPALKNVGSWSTTTVEADPSSSLYNWAIGKDDRARIKRLEFRVPVGTVVQQFNIK